MQRIVIVFLLSLSPSLLSQTQDEKAQLRKLIQERKDHFEEFTKKADEKNGFFGFQSRRDIKKVNETLIEIVKADNKIMYELDRLLSQASYETKQSGRDLAKNDLQKDKYISAIDTLNKQIDSLKKDIRSISWRKRVYKYLDFILLSGILFYFLYSRRKRKLEKIQE